MNSKARTCPGSGRLATPGQAYASTTVPMHCSHCGHETATSNGVVLLHDLPGTPRRDYLLEASRPFLRIEPSEISHVRGPHGDHIGIVITDPGITRNTIAHLQRAVEDRYAD